VTLSFSIANGANGLLVALIGAVWFRTARLMPEAKRRGLITLALLSLTQSRPYAETALASRLGAVERPGDFRQWPFSDIAERPLHVCF
jgi:hypothetical protein